MVHCFTAGISSPSLHGTAETIIVYFSLSGQVCFCLQREERRIEELTFFSSFPSPLKSSEQAAEAAAKLDIVCAHLCCTEEVLLYTKNREKNPFTIFLFLLAIQHFFISLKIPQCQRMLGSNPRLLRFLQGS